MQMIVLRGRLDSFEPVVVFGPDLSKADRANAAYVQMIKEETEMPYAVQTAHRNFLKELVYLLYSHNRLAEANKFFTVLRQTYPDAVPANTTMEEYALGKIMGNLADPSHDRAQAILEGVIKKHFLYLALDNDEQADAYDRMAQNIWENYAQKIKMRPKPLAFPPLQEMKAEILQEFLDPQSTFNPELKARLRARLAPISTPATNRAPPTPSR